MILWHLVLQDKMRYSAIKRSLYTVSHKMLAQSLRDFEGLILRTVHQVVPPQVDYALSDRGSALRPLFLAMKGVGKVFVGLIRPNFAKLRRYSACDCNMLQNGRVMSEMFSPKPGFGGW